MNNTSDDDFPDLPSSSLNRVIFVMSSAIIVLGVTANCFIIVSFCKVHLLRTVTNYFIVNLAVADILLLVTLALWMISSSMSYLGRTVLMSVDVLLSSASLTSLACVSVDRCLAIIVPLRYQSITTHSRAIFVLSMMWVYSVIMFITSCSREATNMDNKVYISCLFAFTFALPILITTVSYYRIFRVVCRQIHHVPKQTNPNRRARFVMKEFRVAINVLVTVVPAYFLWGSFWITTLQEAFLNQYGDYPPVMHVLLSHAPHVAAAVNPLIYISMTRDFRLHCLRLLSCKKRSEELSFVVESRPRTISLRSFSTTQSVPLVEVISSDELARSLTASEDSRRSSSGHCLQSTDSSCVTSSTVDEKIDLPSSV